MRSAQSLSASLRGRNMLLVECSRQLAVRQAHVCFATPRNVRSRRSRRTTAHVPPNEDLQQQGSSSTTLLPAEKHHQQLPQSNSSELAIALAQPPLDPRYAETRSWVVFSDLHMSAKTQDTAMEVLARVRKEASQRGAGVLFLGDFWDRRGDLPVVPLNRVQRELQDWNMPLLLLPGNHDQVDLGGLQHSLFSLQVAAPCAHVFTEPTMFRDALWLPYRRNEPEIRDTIRIALQQAPLKAIFGHADVLTAHMNAAYQARDGLPPGVFPKSIPVYLGHYHYPHSVDGTSITYIGSPFQVSASEAGQQKRLLVLNSDWQQTGEIQLDIGRRFFTFITPGVTDMTSSSTMSSSNDSDSDTESSAAAAAGDLSDTTDTDGGTAVEGLAVAPPGSFLLDPKLVQAMIKEGMVKSGDVVNLKATEDTEGLTQVQKLLQESGAQVQLQLLPKARPAARIKAAEQLSMQQLLEQYAANTGMNEDVLNVARGALQELGSRSSEGPTYSHLQLTQVIIEGFGPFRGAVTYPLADRGVVAVTGRNEDDATAVSNGAGKTSLLTALLWAFKAPDGRSLTIADYVNEDSKCATVTLQGTINQEPFELTRSVTGSRPPKSSLKLVLNGEDVTSQEQQLTERTLEQLFSTSLLPKTLVFTQEDLLALLQSGDAAFKDLLSSVVETNTWSDAKDIAVRNISAIRDELRGQEIRAKNIHEDVAINQRKLQELEELSAAWQQQQQQQQALAEQQEQISTQQVLHASSNIIALQQQVVAAATELQTRTQLLEAEKAAAHAAAEAAAAALDAQVNAEQQQQQQVIASPEALQVPPPKQQQQVELAQFDEAAAAAELQPLLAVEEEGRLQLQQQQAVGQQLRGELSALKTRRRKYEKLQHSSSSSSSSSSLMAAATAHTSSSSDRGHDDRHGLAPVCEQCLQPINLDLYQRNLESMSAEEQRLQQQLTAALDLEGQLRQTYADAQGNVRTLQAQHTAQRAETAAANQQLMEQIQLEQQRAARDAKAREAALRASARKQQQEQERARQQIWQQEMHLQGELNLLEQLSNMTTTIQAKLRSTLTRAAAKSQLQLPETAADSKISSSSAGGSGNSSAEIQAVCKGLRTRADHLCDDVTDAVDGLVAARGSLQQLSALQNPHASGVSQWQQLLLEKQQQLEQLAVEKEESQKQFNLWRRVDLAFGRTGIPSFILEEALGELQSACSRHLSQLAAGMSLELSSTSDKKTGQKSSRAKKAPTKGNKAAKGKRYAAIPAAAATADAAPWDSVDSNGLYDVDKISDQSNLGSEDAALDSFSAAAAAQKEEIAKIVRVRAAGGEMRQRSIAQLSGGEKKRVALALGLGFAELVAARSRLKSNVLVLDEVLEKLDEEGCLCVAQLLKSLPYSSVFVVGQAGSFVTKEFASVDIVVKAGGCSAVEIGALQASVLTSKQ